MHVVKVSVEAIEFIKYMAKLRHPYEFVGLLRERKGVIKEVLLIPRSFGGRGFASLDVTMIPITTHYCGTVHSHPSGSVQPSSEDLNFFSKHGRYHMIIGYPYRDSDITMYDSGGRRLSFKVVE